MDGFISDLNDRARQLVMALDERYQEWVDQLPAFFRDLASAESTYSGRPGGRFYQLSSSVNPVNMHSPWLFWDLFASLDDDQFLNIAEAGAFWSLSAIVLDHLVDRQIENPPLGALFQLCLLQRSRALFREIFPLNSQFWLSMARYEAWYTWSLGVEVDAQQHPEEFTYEFFAESAQAKASTMLVTISAFSEATGQLQLLEPIEKSIRFLALAGQLYDDLVDWKLDLRNGHVTWVSRQFLPGSDWKPDGGSAAQQVEENLEENWQDLDILKDVASRFDQAEEAVRGINCPAWLKFIGGYREIILRDQRARAARYLRKVLPTGIMGYTSQSNE